ncbi:MAG TPA: class I SAM-dependent methyltransferase [Bacillota bacterium]|nr:class I SAM-dependent methyltransferase [Bacillota bacterium]
MALDELAAALADVDGWLSLEEAAGLAHLARTAPGDGRPFRAVEIGSWKGRSTIALALGVRKRLEGGTLWAVDHHRGSAEHRQMYGNVDTYAEFWRNVGRAGLQDVVRPLVMTSHAASARFMPRSVQLLWVDGSHDYASVRQDLDDWLPRLAPRAVAAFDDIGWPGVARALQERVLRPRSGFTRVRQVGKMAIFQYGLA